MAADPGRQPRAHASGPTGSNCRNRRRASRPMRSLTTSPRCLAGRSDADALHDRTEGTPCTCATAVAASTFRRLPTPRSGTTTSASSSGVRDVCARAVDAELLDVRCADVGRARPAEGDQPSGEHSRPRHHAVIVGIGDEHGRRTRAFEDLRLRVGDRVWRAEVARGARRRRSSTRGPRARQAPRGGGSRRRGSSRAPRPRHPVARAGRAAKAAARCGCSRLPGFR